MLRLQLWTEEHGSAKNSTNTQHNSRSSLVSLVFHKKNGRDFRDANSYRKRTCFIAF